MALGYSSTVHALYMEILSTWKIKRTIKRKKRKMGRRLPISRNSTREPRKFAGFPREFVTLRVVQFVLKLAHLAISMEPRGPCTCSLLPRLWLLIMPSSLIVRHYEISANLITSALSARSIREERVSRNFWGKKPGNEVDFLSTF